MHNERNIAGPIKFQDLYKVRDEKYLCTFFQELKWIIHQMNQVKILMLIMMTKGRFKSKLPKFAILMSNQTKIAKTTMTIGLNSLAQNKYFSFLINYFLLLFIYLLLSF